MFTGRSPRWISTLIPIGVSLALSVGIASITNNSLSLLFGLAMPLMLVAPLLERWIDRRHERRAERESVREESMRIPSMRDLLKFGNRRVPPWTLRGDDALSLDHLVRLGVDRSDGRVVRVDVRGGICVTGESFARDACERAISCAIAWRYGLGSGAPRVDGGELIARWLVTLRADGSGLVIDRLGFEPVKPNVALDVMTPVETESFTNVLASYLSSSEVTCIDWDLFIDGPHALVSGVTGSGKTVLLREWIQFLATDGEAPATVGVIDFKGGGAFADMQDLGFVASLATNLAPEGVHLALAGLTALMVARAALLAKHGCSELGQLPVHVRPARSVIIVDEYRALLDAIPSAQTLFVDIASRGRALGVHLILATQRFVGVAGDALTSNCGIRVALRAGDPTESRQVIGVADAYDSSLAAGAGFVVASGKPRRRLRLSPTPATRIAMPSREITRIWLEPLVMSPSWRELQDDPATPFRVRLGLVDNHAEVRREVLTCDLRDTGLLLVVGGERSVRNDLLTGVSQQMGEAPRPSDAVDLWDDLARVHPNGGVIVHDVDALENQLPLPWREPFTELILDRVRAGLAAGHPVGVSTTGDGPLAHRLRQLPHTEVLLDGTRTTLNGREFHASRPHPEFSKVPLIQYERIDSFLGALVITPRASSWRARGIDGLEVADVDDVMFARIKPDDFARVFLDGCTPMEARSLRLSGQHLPPPRDGTILEVKPDGQFVRWQLGQTLSHSASVT